MTPSVKITSAGLGCRRTDIGIIDELSSLTWDVPNLSLSDTISQNPDGTFTASPTITLNDDGTFSFSFSAIDYNSSLSIVIVATDLNDRSTTEIVTLLGDTNGPYIEITSPQEYGYYRSNVNIVGTVRDQDSDPADLSLHRLEK